MVGGFTGQLRQLNGNDVDWLKIRVDQRLASRGLRYGHLGGQWVVGGFTGQLRQLNSNGSWVGGRWWIYWAVEATKWQ